MPRPAIHSEDQILDAARAVVLADGATAATVAAIARASGAPAGSIYHRFGSRDVVLAELWIRASRRSQARWLAAVEANHDPREAVVAAGLSILDFAAEEREEARLLVALRHEDLVRSPLPPATAHSLRELSREVARAAGRLAAALFGSRSKPARELVLLAAFDLPYGAVRRHLIAGKPLPADLKQRLEPAIRAALASGQ